MTLLYGRFAFALLYINACRYAEYQIYGFKVFIYIEENRVKNEIRVFINV